ncbi:MAG: hypothetical protein Q4F45_09015 [Alistipes sp.]|nr:hypothetical protein [Alistipes sp.]
MKLRAVSYLFLLATLCMGCGGHGHMRQLERLEAQLDTAPEVVRLALDSIPYASLDEEERALYAILRTQADYKCYVPLTTDTLIRHATAYYNRNRKSYRAAMAWYSLGCVYTELQDDASAINAYLRARTLFPDTTVRYYRLCHQNLGRHYLNREMFDEAISSFRSCKQRAVSVADSVTVGYCDYYIGCAYLYQKSYDSAEVYFDKVHYNARATNTCQTVLPLEKAKITLYRDRDYERTLYLLSENKGITDESLSTNYSIKSEIYQALGNNDSSYHYLLLSMKYPQELHTQCWNYKRLAELSSLLGQTDSTYHYLEQHTVLLDSIYRLRQQSEINEIRNDFSLQFYQQQLAKKNLFFQMTGIILFVTALLGIWLLFNQRRNKLLKKNLQLDAELAQIRNALLYGTGKEEGDTTSPRLSPEEIYAYYSRLYDMCLQRYGETASYSFMLSSPMQLDKRQRESIIADIRQCFADLVSAIHSAMPNLSADILLTCLCLSFGYSTDTITNLFVISPQTVRSRKSRAKKELSTPLFDLLCSSHPTSKGKN